MCWSPTLRFLINKRGGKFSCTMTRLVCWNEGFIWVILSFQLQLKCAAITSQITHAVFENELDMSDDMCSGLFWFYTSHDALRLWLTTRLCSSRWRHCDQHCGAIWRKAGETPPNGHGGTRIIYLSSLLNASACFIAVVMVKFISHPNKRAHWLHIWKVSGLVYCYTRNNIFYFH